MTFSIAARCPRTGAFGVAVTSSSICVAARCAFVRHRVGAALSQNLTDPELGKALLAACAVGNAAPEAIRAVTETAGPSIAFRQLAVVDAEGRVGHFTGERALGVSGAAEGNGCVAVGNLLAHAELPAAMIAGFEDALDVGSDVHLGAALVMALESGLAAGGETSPVRSAGLLVIEDERWPTIDLRIDWDDAPIAKLSALWETYAPQRADFVQRAHDPSAAPGF
ncbi:MAG: DUF1028 domain-containing protein [Alphaproteobacteria bacterium]|nr:DUF1028 domain-containing protein [Alphaproteobacteria bacterium]